MKRWRSLHARLFVSYAIVVLVAIAALAVTFSLRATSSFDDQIRATAEQSESESHRAFVDSLWHTLPIALLVSTAVAALVTLFVARRILRPIDDVRRATRRLASGHYEDQIDPPAESELAALADDVNRLGDALASTERRRAQLISEVAHEMRTPLTTISGYLEGALDGVFPADEQLLAAVIDETARLERLASDLSTLSRAEEGAMTLDLSRADVGELAQLASTRLLAQFDDKGVQLEVHELPPLPVKVDRDRTLQVLTNLLGNALTYTPPGGRVTVTAERRSATVAVTIADTGAGIAAGDLEMIFERFYRVPGLQRPPGGSGIGLTIARGIARAHHGDITAASAGANRGAAFTLELPIASEAMTE